MISSHASINSFLLDPFFPVGEVSGVTTSLSSAKLPSWWVRALRALISPNEPEQPHLGPPPTLLPMAQEPLSAYPGDFSLDLSYLMGVWVSSHGHTYVWVWTLLIWTPTYRLVLQPSPRPALSPWACLGDLQGTGVLLEWWGTSSLGCIFIWEVGLMFNSSILVKRKQILSRCEGTHLHKMQKFLPGSFVQGGSVYSRRWRWIAEAQVAELLSVFSRFPILLN